MDQTISLKTQTPRGKSSSSRTEIRHYVKEQMRLSEEINIGVDEFQELLDSNHSICLRLGWLTIILCSVCICCYQSQERLFYFLGEPVAVDILYEDIDQLEFPKVKICTLENNYVRKYWHSSEEGHVGDVDAWGCMNPAYRVMEDEGTDLAQIWNLEQYSKIINKVEFKPKNIYQSEDFKKNFTPPNLTEDVEKSLWGACHTVQPEKNLKGTDVYGSIITHIEKPTLCPTASAVLVTLQAPVDFQYTMILFPGSHLVKHLDFKEYHFLAPKHTPCISREEYIHCLKTCIYRLYMKRFNCRMPFLPSEYIPLAICNASLATQEVYDHTLKLILTTSPKADCNCLRRCDQSVLNSLFEVTPRGDDKITADFGIHSHFIRKVQERWNYDIISLLTDIGGNLGLFLGLSVLSITNIISILTFLQLRKTKNNAKQLKLNVVKHKVATVYSSISSKKVTLVTEDKKQVTKTAKWLRRFVFSTCTLLTIYMSIAKLMRYLDEPVSIVVEVEDVDYLTYPNAIHCGLSGKVASRFYKHMNIEPLSRPIDILELVGHKYSKSLEKLWDDSFMNEVDFRSIFSLKNLPFVVREVTNVSRTLTPLGKCLKFTFGKAKYSGMFTFLLTAFTPPMTVSNSDVYMQLPEDHFIDYTSRRLIPYSQIDNVIFEMSKIIRIPRKKQDCLDPPEKFYKCKQICLSRKIQDQVKCSLPFINETDAEPCNTSINAKTARHTYMQIMTKTNIQEDCGCPPACKENFYTTRMYLLQSPVHLVTIVIYFFFNNKIENIKEQFAYGLIPLVCDFGNILGLSLGLSVLAFIRQTSIFLKPSIKSFFDRCKMSETKK